MHTPCPNRITPPDRITLPDWMQPIDTKDVPAKRNGLLGIKSWLKALSHLDVLASVWQGIKMYAKRWRTLNY